MPLGSSLSMFSMNLYSFATLVAFAALILSRVPAFAAKIGDVDSLTYVWPLPEEFSSGDGTLSINPGLWLAGEGDGGGSSIVKDAFDRYSRIIFQHNDAFSIFNAFRRKTSVFDVNKLRVIVHSKDESLQLGVDESYSLSVPTTDGKSIVGEATIEETIRIVSIGDAGYSIPLLRSSSVSEIHWQIHHLARANTVYGALRGLETFSQLCAFDFGTKTVLVKKAPWYIKDKPRFAYRGLLLDTSRHYLPVEVIKHIIDSMSYAKLNVLHWHIIDEQSFPLEMPTYPKLWQGAYSRWERYTVEDAYDIVNFAKSRGIHVMAEVDVPGHAESWGKGYPELWPSSSCREPLDISNNFTFDLISGMLSDMRKIFPFELFHLGGDEVNTDCWTFTPHVRQWLQSHNMTGKDAYTSFVLEAQQIAISKGWTPVNWEETFNNFPEKLDRRTIVHNWLGPGVCPKVVNSGLRCIFSNQGVWYLDHLDVPWDKVYTAEPLEGITDPSKQKLMLGGEVCMWAETADPSNVLLTIWPRAAAAAERLWSKQEAIPTSNLDTTVLPRLHYFRCLLNTRGVEAAPVTNKIARSQPYGPGSCYNQ